MCSIKCFDLSPQVHTVQALSGSTFFDWRRRRHTFSCLFLNENHELSRSHSRQIDLCRQVLHSCDLFPCWRRSKVAGVAHQWTYMHQLLLPELFKVTLEGMFVKEFCYTSGNHGSVWTNFCSPSKTTKLVQISIGLPERASKKCSYWKNQLSTWTLTNS